MLEWLNELWNNFSSVLLSVLPTSPFIQFFNYMESIPYLSWLNWFVPVNDFIKIGVAYLACVGLFYMWMVVARWLKVIGD